MATRKQSYGNESISALKGADRVRKRPGVIFGSDGLDGCEHAVFEIKIAACRKNDAGIIAVIKADGYGHGAVMLAREMDEIPEVIGYAVATEMCIRDSCWSNAAAGFSGKVPFPHDR